MAPNHGKCAKCLNFIQNNEFLTSVTCKKKLDINCAKITSARFYSFYTAGSERNNNWHCSSECSSHKEDKSCIITNTERPLKTPIRNTPAQIATSHDSNTDVSNIATRSKKQNQQLQLSSEEQSPVVTRSPTHDSDHFYVTENQLRAIVNEELQKTLR
jgi:hypothetical protein